MPVRARYSLADAPAKGVFYDPTMTPAEIHAHFDLQRQASREHVDVPLLDMVFARFGRGSAAGLGSKDCAAVHEV